MQLTSDQQRLLKTLPGVDRVLTELQTDPAWNGIPKTVAVRAARNVIENLRTAIVREASTDVRISKIVADVKDAVRTDMTPNLRRVVNATGVVVHTNLGRSLLAPAALTSITDIAAAYSNLELNLETGKRGIRYSAVEDLLCEITGAEAAMAVNNNAGAVLLCLDTLANGKEAVVSRGELVEIGGSFRIPDVMEKSGGRLKEVGTTNRTHLADYEQAINAETGVLLKVHTSNYSLVGFTKAVPLGDLVELGSRNGIPVMEDLGSGTFIDFSDYGLPREPTVQASVAAGVDVVTFSGDKLLGGPQTGIIVGKRPILDRLKKNPLTRALRIDKLTLASLEATLRLYRDPRQAVQDIPTLRMLLSPLQVVEVRAEKLATRLKAINQPRLEVTLKHLSSKVGGGSLPLLELPSQCVALRITGMTTNELEKAMRSSSPAVIGRIEDDLFLMDVRTIQDDDVETIKQVLEQALHNTDK